MRKQRREKMGKGKHIKETERREAERKRKKKNRKNTEEEARIKVDYTGETKEKQ